MERQCVCTRISGLQNQNEEYIELYGYATGIYENAYSCDDLMEVIRQFDADTDPQKFKELTEASDLESVKERIF